LKLKFRVHKEIPMTRKKSQEGKQSQEKQAAKKAIVLGNEKKNSLMLIALLGSAVLLIVIGLIFFNKVRESKSSVASVDQITYHIDLFKDGQARHFQYKTDDGKIIKYFILKSSDGVIRAAFDACDVCWPAGKGYYQKGDFMICRNCGQRFASIRVNVERGGCNPAPLSRKVVNSELIIKVKDILEGKQYFNLPRRG
jgi:uncharacterized membrane protein